MVLKKIIKTSIYDIYSKLKNKNRDNTRLRNRVGYIDQYLLVHKNRKLHIGCGSNLLEGWLNTDIRELEGAVFMDAGEKFPIPDDSFGFIFSEHIFEHLRLDQQLNMLNESYRILKNGGVMRLATPSLDFLYELYRNPQSDNSRRYLNWARQNVPQIRESSNRITVQNEMRVYVINNFFKAWGHELIHNKESLKSLALQSGFSVVREEKVGSSEISELRNIERHGTVIPEEINRLETMVLEFVK